MRQHTYIYRERDTHTHTYACMQAHSHEQAQGCAACKHRNKQVNEKKGARGDGESWNKDFRSLVQELRGIEWFSVEFWTGILLQYSVLNRELSPCDTTQMWKKCVALGNASFILESKLCGRKAMSQWKRMGCTVEADQTPSHYIFHVSL